MATMYLIIQSEAPLYYSRYVGSTGRRHTAQTQPFQVDDDDAAVLDIVVVVVADCWLSNIAVCRVWKGRTRLLNGMKI